MTNDPSTTNRLILGATAGVMMTLALASFAGAEEIPVPATMEAATVWQQKCSTCHGENGKGDGALGAALDPHPRDFTSAEWQKSVTDERLAKVIVEGGQSVGLSFLMVPNPDLAPKPDVVRALVARIRAFAPK